MFVRKETEMRDGATAKVVHESEDSKVALIRDARGREKEEAES